MTELLNEMERAMTDILQAGLATADPALLAGLPRKCEAHGLHTAADLMARTEELLRRRAHELEKDDRPILDAICRAERYIRLCREKLQEEAIVQRWRNEGGET